MTSYFVDGAVGNDANAGTSEGSGNAWATIDKAMNTVAAGDDVAVKASATYAELATIDTAGTSSGTIIFEGYTTTPGDGGVFTIDGSGSSNFGIATSMTSNLYYTFRNMRVTGSIGDGVSITDADTVSFFNCEFDNNDGEGLIMDNFGALLQCSIHNNGSTGVRIDNQGTLHSCVLFTNTTDQILSQGTDAINCLFYGMIISGDDHIHNTGVNMTTVAGCTFDGENSTSVDGIHVTAVVKVGGMFVNNIIYDLDVGIESSSNMNALPLIGYNLINSNTANYNNCVSLGFDVTGAPAFTDEGNDDYSLGSSSPAIDAGTDASEV